MSGKLNEDSQNTPQLNKLAAAQQGGQRGAQLWGVQFDGSVRTIYQMTPGGSWSEWMGSDWAGPGFPAQTYGLAAAQHSSGCVQFWGLDANLELWTTSQSSPGGNWVPWSGPNWNNTPKGMKRLTACRQGGIQGSRLWGITQDYSLVTCAQATAGGQWSAWQSWPAIPGSSQVLGIAAAEQDGHGQLWALDAKRQLWFCWQSDKGGLWSIWHGPNWGGAPSLANITACQQGGSRGTQIWGTTPDSVLISNFQITPGGNWNGWSTGSWMNAPQVYQMTAAEQNNGCIEFWALTLNQVLITISQTSPGGDWGDWYQVSGWSQ